MSMWLRCRCHCDVVTTSSCAVNTENRLPRCRRRVAALPLRCGCVKRRARSGDGERDKENIDVPVLKEEEDTPKEVVKEDDSKKPCYEIRTSDVMGRYLVASRAIAPGTLIMREPALAVGPCAGCGLVCLACYRELDDGPYVKCPGCAWPLCSASCGGVGNYTGHSTYECDTLKGVPPDYEDLEELRECYHALMPLRCLLLKTHDPAKWAAISRMESHDKLRRARGDIWPVNDKLVVQRLKKWGLGFDEDEVHTICGVLETNAFEVGSSGANARALYDRAFLLAHSCVPSTWHTDAAAEPDRALTVRAATRHEPGDLITLSYAYTLQGTLKRREHLSHSKFFSCTCARCADPTELGTYASAFTCPKCSGRVLANTPLDDEGSWACVDGCGYTMPSGHVQLLLNRLTSEYSALGASDVRGLEGFLRRFRNVLHHNHYLFLCCKHSLSQLYGKVSSHMIQSMPEPELRRKVDICRELALLFHVIEPGYSRLRGTSSSSSSPVDAGARAAPQGGHLPRAGAASMPEPELRRKVDICRELALLFHVIEPGYSRLRGVTLYELHAPLMILTTRDFEKKAITRDSLRTRLKEIVGYLTESALILGFEPPQSPEGLMAAAARDALKKIKTWEQIIGKISFTMTTDDEGACNICCSKATQKCAGCQTVYYCSKEHQKKDWKMHKLLCTPARVKEDPEVGRYFEATRDIRAGDVVLKESALITGPSQVTPPVCLGCYQLLEEGKAVPCELCGWPFCSEACSKKEEHKPECYYTQQRGEKGKISTFGTPHPNYQCLTVLRCLYQRDHNPKLWAKLQALQSHCEERRCTEKWNHDKKMVVDFIWKFFKLEGKFSEEEIMKCCVSGRDPFNAPASSRQPCVDNGTRRRPHPRPDTEHPTNS
ncbi:unnamed protein product [Plutella xylostella]|uniref:(diamondback moth) hypothetical protein n=1 Tax=Plutella xylostella TaxID=51655 RepID=A0A8S4FM22_PLUXY|nr:unnamed protein product [Plutella xylostella]